MTKLGYQRLWILGLLSQLL